MPTTQSNASFSFPGYPTFSNNGARVSFDHISAYEITLPALVAAQTGTLSTRTDNDTGVATLTTGHGIVTSGDKVDVYWSGGVRYGMTATVATNDVTIDGGGGDNLPAQSTAVTVVTQVEINPLNLDGDNAQVVGVIYRNTGAGAGMDTGAKAHIDFQDSGSASINELDLVHETAAGGLDEIVNISAGDTNTYTGNPITKGFASHDSTSAGTLYVLAGIDSTL
jgi:hypothetical protein